VLAVHVAHSHILKFGRRQRNPSVTLKIGVARGPLCEPFGVLSKPPETLIKFQTEQSFLSNAGNHEHAILVVLAERFVPFEQVAMKLANFVENALQLDRRRNIEA
jgi:hypothetical protein